MTSAIASSPLLALGKGLLKATLTPSHYSLMNAEPGVVTGTLARDKSLPPRNGEGGIRTLEAGISPPNALAGRRLQPLGHFSGDGQDIGLPGEPLKCGRLGTRLPCTPTEGCRSGRTGRSRKPLGVQAPPGFKSLPLRLVQAGLRLRSLSPLQTNRLRGTGIWNRNLPTSDLRACLLPHGTARPQGRCSGGSSRKTSDRRVT